MHDHGGTACLSDLNGLLEITPSGELTARRLFRPFRVEQHALKIGMVLGITSVRVARPRHIPKNGGENMRQATVSPGCLFAAVRKSTTHSEPPRLFLAGTAALGRHRGPLRRHIDPHLQGPAHRPSRIASMCIIHVAPARPGSEGAEEGGQESVQRGRDTGTSKKIAGRHGKGRASPPASGCRRPPRRSPFSAREEAARVGAPSATNISKEADVGSSGQVRACSPRLAAARMSTEALKGKSPTAFDTLQGPTGKASA